MRHLGPRGSVIPVADRIPYLRGIVPTPRGQPLTVGTPGNANYKVRMALEGQQFLPARGVPHLRRPVPTSRRQPLPLRAPGHALHTPPAGFRPVSKPRCPRGPGPLARVNSAWVNTEG